ncbi:MAG: ABC transporter permease [Planctomycetes bacterium]|nr:ABC transporter permease [Planctomycetota bacterium]
MNRWSAFLQLVVCRIREFFREPHALFWVYGFPIILAVGLGTAFTQAKPQAPKVDVQSGTDSAVVQSTAESLRKAGLKVEVLPPAECASRFKSGTTAMYAIPQAGTIEFVYDPNRSESVLARHWADAVLARASGDNHATLVTDDPVVKPGSRYIDFLMPGLIGMNLMGGGLFGVGFVLVDMRVRKLFKRLMATPMHHGDFLLSLLTSRMVFLLPEMCVLFMVGWLFYSVPMLGSWIALLAVILTGSCAFAGIGLLIGCRTEKTETISGLMNLIMLPMWLLSGVFFSSKRFPDAAQPFIQALPLTQINDALRDVMLEGAGIAAIAWRLGILALWAVVTFALALRWFRWR